MPERLRSIIITILIFMYSGALVQNGLLPIPVSWVNIVAVSITGLLIISKIKAFLLFAWRAKFLVIFVSLGLISTLWSVNPEITLSRSVVLLGASALGIYIATQYDLKSQIGFYARILIIAMVASYIVAIVFPNSGIHQEAFHYGRWKGITIHKNVLGEWMALATVMLVFLPDEFLKLPKRAKYLCAVLSIILLALTVSLTSIFSVLIITLLYPILVILRWDFRLRGAAVLYALMIIVMVIVLVGLNFGDLLSQIGRNATLSGRSIIWPVVIDVIKERPYLGYGYMTFFVPDIYLAESTFYDGWRPDHAHNVWLDTAMDFGLVGISLLIFIIIRGLQQCYELYVRHHRTEVLLVLLFLLNILNRSITETFAMRRRDVVWILFVSVLVRLQYEYHIRNQDMRES